MVPNSVEAGVTPPGFKSSGNLSFSARVTTRMRKVPGTRHMFSTSYLFSVRGGMSCDSGILDLIFAFEKL